MNNPAMDYFLAKFRDERSGTYECNMCVETLSIFLAGEVSKYLFTENMHVKTPLGEKICPVISEDIVLVPVLRAGISMLSGFQRILPKSTTAFIWAHRDENCMAELDQYKFPAAMEGKTAVILDTMLATGGTINLAADLIWKQNPRQIFSVSILAVQDGIGRLSQKINRMFTVGMTDRLDSNQYIYPGVGDSGDRLYG